MPARDGAQSLRNNTWVVPYHQVLICAQLYGRFDEVIDPYRLNENLSHEKQGRGSTPPDCCGIVKNTGRAKCRPYMCIDIIFYITWLSSSRFSSANSKHWLTTLLNEMPFFSLNSVSFSKHSGFMRIVRLIDDIFSISFFITNLLI